MFILCILPVTLALFFPTQIHLSWTENPSEMRVTFQSRFSGKCRISYHPILCDRNNSWQEANCISSREDFGDDFIRYGYVHTGVISNLSSSCYYEYSVSIGALTSDKFVFPSRTPGDKNLDPYTLLVYGDLGTYEIGQKTFELMLKTIDTEDILAAVHLGDIGYNLIDNEGLIGDKFLNMIQPLAGNLAYMTVPGNHEKANNFTQYKMRFKMPKNYANQETSYFYSFDLGYVHYVFLNTNPFLMKAQKIERQVMIDWLAEDLEKANDNRENVPWIVTFHHHLLYCVHEEGNKDIRTDCEIQSAIIRHHLEELFYENHVDLVLSGHLHHYERQAAIYENITIDSEVDGLNYHKNANAPIYIISGSAGNRLKKNDRASKDTCYWSRFKSDDYGFGKLSVLNKTTLYWEQISSESDKVIDYLYIVKDCVDD